MADLLGIKEAADGIKNTLKAGQSLEEAMGDIASFVTRSAEVKYKAALKAKKTKSIAQQAVQEYLDKVQVEEMEDALRKEICRTYGTQAWTEVQRIMSDIKIRTEEAEKQRIRDKYVLWTMWVIGLSLGLTLLQYAKWNL